MTTITNLVTNPTAGTNTAGWSTLANRTITRITSLPAPLPDGLSSHVTTGFQASTTAGPTGTTIAFFDITLAAAAHVAGLYLYVPASWSGGTISFGYNGFSGALNPEADANMSTRDDWQRVIPASITPGAGDLAGVLLLRVSSGEWVNGDTLVFAAVIAHEGDTLHDYFDGDSPNAEWTGTPHASTSVLTLPDTAPRPSRVFTLGSPHNIGPFRVGGKD